jgi:hypothetical protein
MPHIMKEIQKLRLVLEYIYCMVGNTAKVWSFCSIRSDNNMLQMWFNYIPFVLIEHGVKMTSSLVVCTKDKSSM